MNRRVISISILLFSITPAFFGCKAEDTASLDSVGIETPSSISENVPTITPTVFPTGTPENRGEAHEVRLKFWHPFAGKKAEALFNQVQVFNNEFEGKVFIDVSEHADEDSFFADLQGSISSGSIPDVLLAPSQQLKRLNSEGHIIKLNNLLESTGQENRMKDIFPVFWDNDVVDTTRIGIPYIQLGDFLFYNKSWAVELGFSEIPVSVEDFSDQVCQAFQENLYDDDTENIGTGGYLYPENELAFYSWINAFGETEIINNRGEVILDTEDSLNAFTFLYDLFLDDCAWTGKEAEPYRYFTNRNTLIYSNSMSDMLDQIGSDEEYENNDDWELIPYPSISGRPIVFFESFSFGIMDNPKQEVDAAWQFIEWMMIPKNHADMIKQTGSFPVNTDEIQLVEQGWAGYQVWKKSLQYIPFLQKIPQEDEWYVLEKIIADVGWQVIQFPTKREDISGILQEAETLANIWNQ